MQLKPGTLLQNGEYKIIKVLGQGDFGITYLADQTGLHRKVAIKEFFMKEYCERDMDTSSVSLGTSGSKELVEKFREKFVKEAQNIAGFSHNNIIKIYDVFEENNTAYYVMEYLDCGTLSDYLSDRGRLSEEESLTFIRQIADALSYIHKRKVNHLDVKPGNILLDQTHNAILIDFGLSKHYDERGGQTSSTPVGISHGYAPLEQYKQGGVSTFSPATDIYALGATFYKLVTGSTPPEADEIYENGLSFPSDVDLSESMKGAIAFAMQPRSKDRPQSIEEFLKALEVKKVTEDEGTDIIEIEVGSEIGPGPAPGPTPKPNPKKWLRMLMISMSLIGVIVLMLIMKPIKYEGDYVDLGLSVKWGDCNIGADKTYEYGKYLEWRKAIRKQNSTWRLPTKAELEELKENCTWSWTTQGGKKGYKVTGPNGNSIFLPAAGGRGGVMLSGTGEYGFYWGSTPVESGTDGACDLAFNSGAQIVDWEYRSFGRSVRPVSE